ncbi:MmgE/PrpD family protein [Phenylobacterium sp.]|uniref:MmgE/PrpD family protein n=1 Tax=Phenylobacterium sp. TaxID=1871053 RepID=UPI00344CDAC3
MGMVAGNRITWGEAGAMKTSDRAGRGDSGPTANRRRALAGSALALAASALPVASRAQSSPPRPDPPVTEALCRFVAGSQDAPVPDDILDLGRLHILDTLASAVACRDLKAATLARGFAEAQSGDARRSAVTILATRDKAALIDAVFASAMTAHAAEINDYVPSAFVQPGPSVVAAALGLAEQRGLSGAEMLKAVIVGYELASRVPKALGNRNLMRAGLANHGVGPVFGVAAAAASLMRLSPEQVGAVLTYCSQQAAGSWQWLLDVEHVEKAFVFAGMGARSGLQAALFAELGFTGVRANLDQPGGFMAQGMFNGPDSDLDRASLIDGLGERWEMPLVGFKRFPTGGPTQPAVQGLLQLLPQVRAETTAGVRIEMPGRWEAFRDAAMPALNLRYLSAIILIDRRLDFVSAQSLERMAGDAQVRSFMERVEIAHDPAQEARPGQPRAESARVIVTDASGRRHEAFVPNVPGYPPHPMSREDVESKAAELMAPRLGERRAAAVVDACRDLARLTHGADLAHLIAV